MTEIVLAADNATAWSVLASSPPADQHPALVYLGTLDERSSQRTMRDCLNIVARLIGFEERRVEVKLKQTRSLDVTFLDVPWSQLRFQHVARIRALLKSRYSVSSANRALYALRGVLNNAFDLGLLDADELAKCLRAAKRIRGEEPPPATGRAITQAEFEAMLAVCLVDRRQDGLVGRRDAAIIALSWVTGMRRGELARLDLADLDTAQGVVRVHKSKNNTTRLVPVGEALPLVLDYLKLRGDRPGPLFVSNWTRGRYTPTGLYLRIKLRAQQAGLPDLTHHDFRRTVAGDLLDAGVDLVAVRDLLGHANINTTAGYDRRGERAKLAAVTKRHVPYGPPQDGETDG